MKTWKKIVVPQAALNYARSKRVLNRDNLVSEWKTVAGVTFPRSFKLAKVIYINDTPFVLLHKDFMQYCTIANISPYGSNEYTTGLRENFTINKRR